METKSQNVPPKTVREFNSITNQRHVCFNQLLKEHFLTHKSKNNGRKNYYSTS